MITPIVHGTQRWVFADILGVEIEMDLVAGTDVDGMSCHLVKRSGMPIRSYPKLYAGHGRKRGEIIPL